MDLLDRRHQRMVGGAKPVRIPSKKNRASKGGRKLISACDAADTENEFPQVVPCTSPDQKHSNVNVDDHPRNSIFSPAYHHQKECGVRLLVTLAKGLEHKGDTLGSASPIEEDKTHDHGRKEATTVRSGSNQGICLIYLWWFPSFSLFSFQSKLGAALQLPLYLIWMKHSCIQLLDPVRMLISHFQFILTSESTQ